MITLSFIGFILLDILGFVAGVALLAIIIPLLIILSPLIAVGAIVASVD